MSDIILCSAHSAAGVNTWLADQDYVLSHVMASGASILVSNNPALTYGNGFGTSAVRTDVLVAKSSGAAGVPGEISAVLSAGDRLQISANGSGYCMLYLNRVTPS
jgi:hypothetical protein